jgi:hypothetical protein
MCGSDGGGEQVAQQALRVEGHGDGLLQIDSSPQMPRDSSWGMESTNLAIGP